MYSFLYLLLNIIMGDIDKNLKIESWEQWLLISKWVDNQVRTTDEELIDSLLSMPDSDKFLKKLQLKQSANRFQLFKSLRPTWFEHSSIRAKNYRQSLENNNDIRRMNHLKSVISYNPDGTLNILPLNITFCKNIKDMSLWSWCDIHWPNAKAYLDQIKSEYRLMTAYNDSDTDEEKQQSDVYQIMNLLDRYWWSYTKMTALKALAWMDDLWTYLTATDLKDENWNKKGDYFVVLNNESKGLFLGISADHYCFRFCGIKNIA